MGEPLFQDVADTENHDEAHVWDKHLKDTHEKALICNSDDTKHKSSIIFGCYKYTYI